MPAPKAISFDFIADPFSFEFVCGPPAAKATAAELEEPGGASPAD
jgi:hypothetical protein